MTIEGDIPADFPSTSWDVIVGTLKVQHPAGLRGLSLDQGVSRITGPGNRPYGHNLQLDADGADFFIRVFNSSPSLGQLFQLARGQDLVDVRVVASRNLDVFTPGQPVELGGFNARLGHAEYSAGDADEASVWEFPVSALNVLFKTKQPA